MKSLINYITEGSWGYEPLEGDLGLDWRDSITDKIFLEILDLVNFKHKEWVNGGQLKEVSKGDSQWTGIGTFMFFFERLYKDVPILSGNDRSKWPEIIKNTFKELKENKKWQNNWNNSDKMLKTIDKVEKDFDKLMTQYNKRWNH